MSWKVIFDIYLYEIKGYVMTHLFFKKSLLQIVDDVQR